MFGDQRDDSVPSILQCYTDATTVDKLPLYYNSDGKAFRDICANTTGVAKWDCLVDSGCNSYTYEWFVEERSGPARELVGRQSERRLAGSHPGLRALGFERGARTTVPTDTYLFLTCINLNDPRSPSPDNLHPQRRRASARCGPATRTRTRSR